MVLGKIGRNFAAGMSGGRAFVLDLDPRLVNGELVDVTSLPSDQETVVRDLISKFYQETGSLAAAPILADWENQKSRISMILPRDYARVLSAIERAKREGLPVDSVIMEAING